MKDYQKPEIEIISLQAQEAITDDELFDDFEQGLESVGDFFG